MRDPDPITVLPCGHVELKDDSCATIDCENYITRTQLRRSHRRFTGCRCPEQRAGWSHRMPIDCSPLMDGESIEDWRERRYGPPVHDSWGYTLPEEHQG